MLSHSIKTTSYIFAGLVSFTSLAACAQQHVNRQATFARNMTVCNLYSHADQMSGDNVRLSGIYTTDRVENTTITDPHCPKVWILPYDAIDKVDRDSLKRFNDVVEGELSDSSLRVFCVVLFGKFVWQQNKNPHGIFYIQKVIQFKRLHSVNPWSQKSAK